MKKVAALQALEAWFNFLGSDEGQVFFTANPGMAETIIAKLFNLADPADPLPIPDAAVWGS